MTVRVAHPARSSDTAKTPHSNVTASGTAATLVAANPQRIALWVGNTHATQYAYLSLGGTAEVSKGIVVPPATYTANPLCIQGYTGAVSVIAGGAGTNIAFTEI